jgi:salicylate hydroxylase
MPAAQAPPQISRADTTIWLMPGAHVVHYPVRAGAELAIVAIFDDRELGETWAETVEPSLVRSRARAFPQPLRDLLTQPSSWRQWSLYASTASIPWVRDRIVLIGDAAHPTLPFLAQGGVMALEDAGVLSALLRDASASEFPARLTEFERLRRPRTTRIVNASARNGAIYHQDGLMRAARNRVLGTLPPHILMRQYDWLYGWRPEDVLTSARTRA